MPSGEPRPRLALAALLLGAVLAGCSLVGGPAQPAPEPTAGPVVSQPATAAPEATAAPIPTEPPAQPTLEPSPAQPSPAPLPTAPVATKGPLDPAPSPPPGVERIAFAPGAISGVVEGALVRGEERRYLLWAQAGQLMDVRVTSLENNAVFQLYAPDGSALPGAEPGSDARAWSGTLPADGDQLIVVGSTRGNATYRLEVTVTTPAQPGGDTSIRSANWDVVLANDPALRVEYRGSDRYVTVDDPAAPISGIPQLDQIVYVDMDGDGVEEAAMPLFSGGTAGNIGALIFRMGARSPVLVDKVGGYKLAVGVEQGRLVVSNALYAGWEPNCCPSGRSYDTYVLQGGRLQLLAHRDEGIAEAQPLTVERFYELIRRKELAAAYGLLSAAQQAANPYDAWAAGFANTIDVQATVSVDPSAPNTVSVALTATDATPEGGQVTRRFAGTWRMVWDPARPGWALDAANITPVP